MISGMMINRCSRHCVLLSATTYANTSLHVCVCVCVYVCARASAHVRVLHILLLYMLTGYSVLTEGFRLDSASFHIVQTFTHTSLRT